jgi:hypothetical protein
MRIDSDDKFKWRVRDIIENMKGDSLSVRTVVIKAIPFKTREKMTGNEMARAYEIVAEICEAYGGVVSRYLRGRKTPRWRVYTFG